MDNSREDQIVYEVLGQALRLKKDEMLDGIMPAEIVSYVQTEASHILNKSPKLSDSQLAVLVALKIAGEKLSIEKEYRETVGDLKMTAKEALRFMEEITPSMNESM